MDFFDITGEHKSKWMQLPRIVVIGHRKIRDVGEVCRGLGLSGSALIVSGPKTSKIAGNAVSDTLRECGIETRIKIIADASMEEVKSTEKLAGEMGANFLLGVGGGKCIDIAKATSFALGMPFISAPTAASHDGITSSRASISGGDCESKIRKLANGTQENGTFPVPRIKDSCAFANGNTTSVEAHVPIAVVADTELISKAPYRLLASGCGDLISNYTAVRDWQLAYRLKNIEYSSYAAALSQMTAQMIIESADTIKEGLEESAWIVAKGLVSSGVAMSIAGSSFPASGSEHKFSHALDKIAPKPALHGEECGVGAIMMMYLHRGDWNLIRDTLKKVGTPVCASEIGIEIEYIIEALVHAHEIYPERYSILGNGITRKAAKNLIKITKIDE